MLLFGRWLLPFMLQVSPSICKETNETFNIGQTITAPVQNLPLQALSEFTELAESHFLPLR